MALRDTLAKQPELIQDFDLAAEQKYYEGLELMVAGRSGGGIYLMGYAAEMWLKAAGFRVAGNGPAVPIKGLLVPAESWGRHWFRAVKAESFHSLRFWQYYLVTMRRHLGRPLQPALENELVRRVDRLYSIWWHEMRYRRDQATPQDALDVDDDVTWLMYNYASLWR